MSAGPAPGSNAALQRSNGVPVDLAGGSSPFVNLRKQAKYAVIGSLGVWYWQVHLHIADALQGPLWTRAVASLAIALYLATSVIFAYIILLPARGQQADYLQWQKDARLKKAIPLLTACIVVGYLALFLALSPLCAPLPPSAALSQRLSEAASAAGGNFQKAKADAQALLIEAARSLGFGSGSSSKSVQEAASKDFTSLLRALRLPDGEALAARLGVSNDRTSVLVQTLDRYQRRAQAWKENNVSVLGWTGATCGSGSAFALLFGIAGLLGLFTPKQHKTKRATL